MPKTFLHQSWHRNRQLYMMMGPNMAGCGICTVTNQNIHRMQDSWDSGNKDKLTMMNSRGRLREVSCCYLVWHLWNQEGREMTDYWAFLPYWKRVLEWNIWSPTLAKADWACTRKLLEKESWSSWKANEAFGEKSFSTTAVNIQNTGLNRWLKSLCAEIASILKRFLGCWWKVA